jgi:hypothetical protein
MWARLEVATFTIGWRYFGSRAGWAIPNTTKRHTTPILQRLELRETPLLIGYSSDIRVTATMTRTATSKDS